MTSKRPYTRHKLTGSMLKRLAQLASPSKEHNHGTSMHALYFRKLVTGWEQGNREPWPNCCTLTEAGREALADARREGW